MRPLRVLLAAAIVAVPVLAAAQTAPANGTVTLASPEAAIALALGRSPILRSAAASRQAVRAEALSAPLRPNPDASIAVENFGGLGGRGDLRGARGVETTIGLSQRIEIGGQRAARIAAAARSGDVAALEYEGARLDLARDVVVALAEAEAASRTVGVERERARLAAETLRVARARVEGGRDPLLQAQRAEVARATAEVAADRARREAEIALANLAVLVAAPRVELAPRQPWFDDIGPAPRPPVPADPVVRLAANPDLARFEAAVEAGRAAVALQRTTAIPDVTVQGYVRRFQESRETAFVAGASIPLPIYDRNQGGIARAQAELLRADAEAQRGRANLVSALVAAEERTALAWRSAQSLRRDALPAAEGAARAASVGFAEGKFAFIEVLDAQRALSDVRASLVDALREFHARRAASDRLRGNDPGSRPNGATR